MIWMVMYIMGMVAASNDIGIPSMDLCELSAIHIQEELRMSPETLKQLGVEANDLEVKCILSDTKPVKQWVSKENPMKNKDE